MHWSMPLAVLCAMPLAAADSHRQVVDLFTSMAGALSNADPAGFMKHCDPAMPGYQQLGVDVAALVRQAEVLSSIEFIGDEGDDAGRTVELDWFLQIRPRGDFAPLVRRRQAVKCKLEHRQGKWQVTALEPLGFFAPPELAGSPPAP